MKKIQKTVSVGGGKLQDNLEHFEKWKRGENPGPLSLEIGCVQGCNLSCAHCAAQLYDPFAKKINYFNNSEAFVNLLNDFKLLGGQEVYFAGTGEPTINPNLADWIEHGNDIGLDMSISTNGILFKGKLMQRLLHSTKWIRFSVSAGDVSSYVKVHNRKESNFDILFRHIEKAIEYRDQHKLKTKLTLLFVAFDLNWDSLPDLIEIHKKLGTDTLIIKNAVLEDDFEVKDMSETKARPIKGDIEPMLREFEKNDKVEVRWDTFGSASHPNWKKCYGINFKTIMDPEGNLFSCARQYHQPSIYGNIEKNRFMDIWNSKMKKSLFEEVESGDMIHKCGYICQSAQDNSFIEKNKLLNTSRDSGYSLYSQKSIELMNER